MILLQIMLLLIEVFLIFIFLFKACAFCALLHFINFVLFFRRKSDSMNDKIDIIVAGVNWKDKKMWGDFYDRFYTALCVYVSKILPVPDAVEDLVQEVFISVWEGKRTFSDIKELTNYLYRACYNNALLYIRNNQIHDTILSSLAEEESMVDEDTIYALTVKEEIIRQLYCYIEELPAEQRRIILMRIEGHTWEEIAELQSYINQERNSRPDLF